MLDDPIETEQWLALNAYLCFCCAFGCFYGSIQTFFIVRIYLDEMFYLGFGFAIIGASLLALADFRVPTAIWRYVITHKAFAR